MENKTYAIESISITKKYKNRTILDRVTFTVTAGTITGLIGSNGAGKTTLMRILLGLSKPSSGSLKVLALGENEKNKYLKKVGALIENPAFYPELTARKNLEIIALYLDVSFSEISDALDKVGLANSAEIKVGKFSLGMKQRLAIASILLGKPELIILDEPTNGLDPDAILQLRKLILELKEKGNTVLISSHYLTELELIVEDLIYLENGAIKFAGKAQEFISQNGNSLAESYQNIKEKKVGA